MRRIETLLNYIKYHNVDKVKSFFTIHNININDKSLDRSLLEYAIERKNKEIIFFLLEKGADVNCQNAQGMNAAMLMLSNKLKLSLDEKIKFLSPNLEAKDKTGSTLLTYTVYFEDFELTQYLIERQVDLDSQNDDLKTALHYTVEKNNISLSKLLLQSGANPNLIDKHQDSLLTISTNLNNDEISELLIEYKANIEYVSKEGNSPFLYALLNNNLNLSKKLFFDKINLEAIKKIGNHYNLNKDSLNYFATLQEKNALEKKLVKTPNQTNVRKI